MSDPKFAAMAARFSAKPHGTRHRYLSGCRCVPCRAANSRYETARAADRKAGDWNGYVSANAARAHILRLGRAGVGQKLIVAACDVPYSIVHSIATGRRLRIRARTERRIVAVDATVRGDNSLVDSAATWRLLDRLLEGGYSKVQLARWIVGPHARSLQLKRGRITARTASRVERVYQMLQDGKLRRDR